MWNVTYAHSKSFPSPFPRLCAKQSSTFIKNESQILQSKDNFFLTRFMGKKKKITIFTEKNVNPDGEVIQLTPMLSFPYKLQPHQQVFTFIRLQVSLESP